jgi:hypothetical protein
MIFTDKAFFPMALLTLLCLGPLCAAPISSGAAPSRSGALAIDLGENNPAPSVAPQGGSDGAPEVKPLLPEALSPGRLAAVKWGSGALSFMGLGLAAYGISESFQGMGNTTDRSRFYGGLSCVVIGSVVAALFGGVSSHYASAGATSSPK